MRVVYRSVVSCLALLCAMLALSACGSSGRDNVSAAGATTGSLPSSKSTVIGGIATNEIGRGMGMRERVLAADAEYRALEYGQSGTPVDWDGQDRRGSIVPGRPYKSGDQYCRPYTHTLYRGEAPHVEQATACRSQNGVWRSVG
jgi:surface antigen